jgi:O-antigen ligase
MKYVALSIGLFGVVPLALLLRGNAAARKACWLLIGLIPFIMRAVPVFDVALVSWHEFWTGYISAIQISAIDLIAIAIYFSIRHQTNDIRYHLPFVLYLVALSLSVFQADMPLAAVFAVSQFARIYFLTFVIAKACTDETVPPLLLKGLAIGLALQVVVVGYQKFGLGIIQPSGTFVHQNTLGLIMHFVVIPHVALLLAGQRRIWTIATPLAGLIVAALTASRGALGFAAFGIAVTFGLSVLRHWTGWKTSIGVVSVALAVVLAPIAYSSFEKRFDTTPLAEDQYDERAAFNRAALSILAEHPFGVGANHYPYVGKHYGYSVRAGVVPVEGNLNSVVHNAYYLSGAEAGYPGLIAFTLLIICPIWIALRYTLMARNDPRGDLLLGLGVAVLTVAVHSLLEYIIVVQEVQYVLAIIFGMTFGIAQQIKTSHTAPRREAHGGARPPTYTAGRALR